MTEHSAEELKALITNTKESLSCYSRDLSKINPSNIENSQDELIKISKILFAHTTKVGITFKPPVAINASYQQLTEVLLVLQKLVSLNSQIQKEDLSLLYKASIQNTIMELINTYSQFMDQLSGLDFGANDKLEGRLLQVGKAWDICQYLENLVKGGELQLLKHRLKVSVTLIEDVLEEFEEWLENPEIVDEDPFGIEELDSSDEDENEEIEKVIDPSVLEFANDWKDKIKLLKLLLSSLIKSLPDGNASNHKDIDIFDNEQNTIISEIDDLTSNIFMNNKSCYELDSNLKSIQKKTENLIKLVKDLNKQDEKKSKWLQLWQEKFLQS